MHPDVLYADPPWGYVQTKNKGSLTTRGRGWKYLPMGIPQLRALSLPCARDALVFCWCTAPLLPTQLAILEDDWGLREIRVFRVWIKTCRRRTTHPFFGVGFYTAANAEYLVVGARGAPRASWKEEVGPPRAVWHPIGVHSQKPVALRRAVAAATPGRSRHELFARDCSDPEFTYHGDQQSTLTSGNASGAATMQATPLNVAERTRPAKRRRRLRTATFNGEIKNPNSPAYRVLWIDVDLEARQRIDLTSLRFDQHAFVVTRLEPTRLRASVDWYEAHGLLYKTVLFVSSSLGDDAFEAWLVGTTTTTRITTPGVKRTHRSSVLCGGASVQVVADALTTVFGADATKGYVGVTAPLGFELVENTRSQQPCR